MTICTIYGGELLCYEQQWGVVDAGQGWSNLRYRYREWRPYLGDGRYGYEPFWFDYFEGYNPKDRAIGDCEDEVNTAYRDIAPPPQAELDKFLNAMADAIAKHLVRSGGSSLKGPLAGAVVGALVTGALTAWAAGKTGAIIGTIGGPKGFAVGFLVGAIGGFVAGSVAGAYTDDEKASESKKLLTIDVQAAYRDNQAAGRYVAYVAGKESALSLCKWTSRRKIGILGQ